MFDSVKAGREIAVLRVFRFWTAAMIRIPLCPSGT